MEDIIIGSHVSFKRDGELVLSVKEACSYGANTFMFYTGAPQNTVRSEINDELTKEAYRLMAENKIDPKNVIVHAPYIINLASTGDKFDFAVNFLKQEIKRVEKLGFNKIVLHPGSHVGIGANAGISNIIAGLNKVFEDDTDVIILLETMAGKGTECGRDFYEIKAIIDGVKKKKNIGVCLDTCHINDAGYDLSNFDNVLNEFDKIIGLSNLYCIHVNDSKNSIGSHKDRHENIGFGTIGFDNLLHVLYHEKLSNIPKILETPYIPLTDSDKKRAYPPYKFEIEMIKNKTFNPNLISCVRSYYK